MLYFIRLDIVISSPPQCIKTLSTFWTAFWWTTPCLEVSCGIFSAIPRVVHVLALIIMLVIKYLCFTGPPFDCTEEDIKKAFGKKKIYTPSRFTI